MNSQNNPKDLQRYQQIMPIYLGIQATILLLAYLDTPAYIEAYQRQGFLTAAGWVGVWFVLEILGLASGLTLLISRTWIAAIPEPDRVKLAAGFLLGALSGLLSLGMRFFPIMPPAFFWFCGGLLALLIAGYWVWYRRRQARDDLFP